MRKEEKHPINAACMHEREGSKLRYICSLIFMFIFSFSLYFLDNNRGKKKTEKGYDGRTFLVLLIWVDDFHFLIYN